MEQGDRDFHSRVFEGEETRVRKRPGGGRIQVTEVVEEPVPVAKRQLDEEREMLNQEANAAQEARMNTVMESIAPEPMVERVVEIQNTRMAGKRPTAPRRIRVKDLTAEEREFYNVMRAEQNEARKKRMKEAMARGERVRQSPYAAEKLPAKKRGPAPVIQESTGREVVPMPKKKRRDVPPVGLAQRIGFQITKRIVGLSGRWLRLRDTPTKMELSMKRKGKTLQQIRMQALEAKMADLKWELEQDGFAQYLASLPYNMSHYKLAPISKVQLINQVSAIPGEKNRIGTRHFTGASYGTNM